MKSLHRVAILTGSLMLAAFAHAGSTVYYVDDSAPSGGNGLSWATAFHDLQDALAAPNVGEIRIGAGIYVPSELADPPDSRSATFMIPDGVALRGGYAGFGAPNPDLQDPLVYVSTLSGDVAGDDQPNFLNYDENVYHVVTVFDLNGVLLEGLTISGGNASGTEPNDKRGGGLYSAISSFTASQCNFTLNRAEESGAAMYCLGLSPAPDAVLVESSSFTANHTAAGTRQGGAVYTVSVFLRLLNSQFSSNTSSGTGGAVYISGPDSGDVGNSMEISNCAFESNSADDLAGAIAIKDVGASNTAPPLHPVPVRDCSFIGNSSLTGYGGAVVTEGSQVRFVRCDFQNNVAQDWGGALYAYPQEYTPLEILNCRFLSNAVASSVGGAVFCSARNADTVILNAHLSGNTAADRGGAVFAGGAAGPGIVRVVNSSIVGNHADAGGGGIYAEANGYVVANSILWQNSRTAGIDESAQIDVAGNSNLFVNYCCVDGWTGTDPNLVGTAVTGSDPLLTDANGADNAFGTPDDDVHPLAGSPVIDAGDNAEVPADVADLDGDGNTTEPAPLDLDVEARFLDDPATTDTGSGTPPIVDMGAFEFGTEIPSVMYVGPSGGSWFTASNWSGGEIPDGDTNVVISNLVVIDNGVASANEIEITSGGTLSVQNGSLDAQTILVRSGGTLALTEFDAQLTAADVQIEPGATLNWTSGTLHIAGGQLTIAEILNIGCTNSATLEITDGGQVAANAVNICSNGTLIGDGGINCDVSNSGILRMLADAGALAIDGVYTQSAQGVMQIELHEPLPGTPLRRLTFEDDVNLDGALDVIAPAGWTYEIGALYEIYDATGQVGGNFDQINLPALPAGVSFLDESDQDNLTYQIMLDSTGPRLYVDADAPPGGDGQSWTTATRMLASAAVIHNKYNVDEIWVAEGTYYPTERNFLPDPRTARFGFERSVDVYGGFTGSETSIEQRDWVVNETILSGDLGVPGDDADNAYNVVSIAAQSDHVRLDGFTVSFGRAGGFGGGGIHLTSPSTIAHCILRDNQGNRGGGVFANSGGLPVTALVDCLFEQNAATEYGAAVWMSQGTILNSTFQNNDATDGANPGYGGALHVNSTVSLDGCEFIDNNAIRGGAVSSSGELLVEQCSFRQNIAENRGGAIHSYSTGYLDLLECLFIANESAIGGGAVNCERDSRVVSCAFYGNAGQQGAMRMNANCVLFNSIISGNHASTEGGGFWFSGNSVSVSNCAFVANTATIAGGGIRSYDEIEIANTILWNNSVGSNFNELAQVNSQAGIIIDYSCVEGWTGAFGGAGNIGADPQFADPLGPDLIAGTEDDDLHIATGSPCVDSGSNFAVYQDIFDLDEDGDITEPTPYDADRFFRFAEDPMTVDTGSGTPPIVDMGPHEYLGDALAGLYVGPPGGSWFEPSNWNSGEIPTASTNVYIDSDVVINAPGAVALQVQIWTGGSLTIGSGGLTTNQLTVYNGASLHLTSIDSLLIVHSLIAQAGSDIDWIGGTIRLLAGGLWNNATNSIQIGCNLSATLIVESEALVMAPTIDICSAGLVRGTGTLVASVANNGLIQPGLSAGTLTIEGPFMQGATGELQFELGGYAAGDEYDQLIVDGNATLEGTLTATLLPAFAPSLGRDQNLIIANIFSGEFSTTNVPSIADPFLLQLDVNVPTPEGLFSVRLFTTIASNGPRLYVNAAASDGGDGQSWATAVTEFRAALAFAAEAPEPVIEFWVAEGTYAPAEPNGDREKSFLLQGNGLRFYGGFDGTETVLEERDPVANPTILTGDLNGNDSPDFTGNGENSYHVIRANTLGTGACIIEGECFDGFDESDCNQMEGDFVGQGTTCAAMDIDPIVIDGFIITSGNANGSGADRWGGGVYSGADYIEVRNCHFIRNRAQVRGGGMFWAGNEIDLDSCAFVGNRAFEGGGLSLQGPGTHPQINACLFEDNEAPGGYGGGTYVSVGTNPTFANCMFLSNFAGAGGGLLAEPTTGLINIVLDTCVFEQNEADASGGGIEIEYDTILTATDCDFIGNMKGGIRNTGGVLTISGGSFVSNTENSGLYTVGDFQVDNVFLDDVTFTENDSPNGGGAIRISSGGVVATDCFFDSNSSPLEGGAIYLETQSQLRLYGGQISGNTAAAGSAIYNHRGVVRTDSHLLAGQELLNTGEVRPESEDGSAGILTIDGSYVQQQAPGADAPRLIIRAGGTVAGVDYDQVDVSGGSVILNNGSLVLELADAYQPPVGTEFEIMPYGSISGQFDIILIPLLPANLVADIEDDGASLNAVIEAANNPIAFTVLAGGALGAGDPTAVTLADLNGDGYRDVAVSTVHGDGADLYVAENFGNSGGNWQGLGTSFVAMVYPGSGIRSMVAAPLDGDFVDDLALAVSDRASVLLSPADGTFDLIQLSDIPLDGLVMSVDAGTNENDTSRNIALVTMNDDEIWHLINNGSAGFTEQFVMPGFGDPLDVAMLDFSGDGFDDLAVCIDRPSTNPEYVRFLEWNDQSGSFVDSYTHDVPRGTTSIRKGDLDGDGLPEIMTFAPSFGQVSIFSNDAGTLQPPLTINLDGTIQDAVLTDLDADGDLDILASVTTGAGDARIRVIRNDQNGGDVLILATAIDLEADSAASLLSAADLNDDGFDDFVAIGSPTVAAGTAPIAVYLNNARVMSECPADLDNDADVDFDDFTLLLASWGDPGCGGAKPCAPDIDGDSDVDFDDFTFLLASWGACR